MKKRLKRGRRYPKVDRKYGEILGIKVSITPKEEVLEFINSRLDSNEKFYIVTPNPENLLLATKDWLLAKAIRRSNLSIPDGIGLAQAYKFLNIDDPYKHHKDADKLITKIYRAADLFYKGIKIGFTTFTNKTFLTDGLPVIKGRELFLDIIKIADERKLKVYLFGGEHGENQQAISELKERYKNITFQTNYKFPQYNKNGQPVSVVDRKMHKSILGSIKIFEPDIIFVAMNTPKQEKWIYRNFFRIIKCKCAMTVGGTFNYVAGNMKLPPLWMDKLGLEWLFRLIQEPKRFKRIVNAIIVFPLKVYMWKLNPPTRTKLVR